MHRDVVLGRPREALLAAKDASEVTELAVIASRWHVERDRVLAFFEAATRFRQIERALARLEGLDAHRTLGAHDLDPPVRPAEGVAVIAAEGHGGLRVFQNRQLVVGQSTGSEPGRLATGSALR